ncbi:MAG: PAS domain S-box protein [Cyanobacteria bacterium P01_G01_bin.54]
MPASDPSPFPHPSIASEIVVVDDTPTNLQVLQEILKAEGHRVRLAHDPQRAIATITEQAPDLILLDVMMPGMNGFELCEWLKANPATTNIPVIFITALTAPQDKVRAFEVGGVDYIAKPFQRLEVLARVRHQLAYRRTQAALQASEQQMRAIFAAMTDLVVIRDRQGHCLEVAPTQATQALASEQELLASTLEDVVEPDEVAVLHQAIETTLDQQCTQQLQYQRLQGNGKTWLDARLSPLTDESVVWVARDISQTKAIEHKLQRNEQEMRRIFEAMTDLVLAITPAHQDIRVMPTRYAQTAAAASAVIEATFAQIFGPTPDPSAQAAIAAVLATQQPRTWEYQLPASVGNLWFSANISLLSAETVLWVARDISDRVQAQQAVEQLAAELEQRVIKRTAELQTANADLLREINERRRAQARWERSELRFQVAVDNLPDLFMIYDAELRYQFVNQKVLQLMALDTDEILGKSDLELLPEQIYQTYLPLLEQTVQTGQIQRGECSIRIPEQGQMTFVVTYVPLLDNQGKLTILGIAHDITERKRSEQALNQAKEQLQSVIDAVPGFISWVGILNPEAMDTAPEFYYLGVNRNLAQLHQLSAQDFIGQPLDFLNSGEPFQAFLQQLFAQTDPKPHKEVITPIVQGQPQSYLVTAQKYNQSTAAVLVGIDISDRVRIEQRLQQAYERSQLLSELTLKVRQSLEIDEIVYTAVWELQALLQADRVALIQSSASELGTVVQETHAPGCLPLDPQVNPLHFTAADFEANEFIVIDDTQTSPAPSLQTANLAAQQPIRAQLIVPIYVQQTFWGGVIVQYIAAPHAWTSDEIELLLSLADQIGIALAQAQLLNELEDLVAERTQELRQEVLERRRAEQALRTSQDQLQRIIQNSAYGIVICNLYGEIQFANPAALQLFSRRSEELLGFNLGIPISTYEQTELSILPPQDSSPRTVEMRSGEIYWQEQPGYIISLMDITERKQVEQMKDEFLSIASHELRTPLTSIRGALGLLASGKLGSFTPQGQSMIDIAVNNTQRLTRLLDDILDLERISSGRLTLIKTEVNVVSLILQAAQALEALATDHQVTLQLNANQKYFAQIPPLRAELPCVLPTELWIWADSDQLIRVLINLMSNAIKFSEPGQTVEVNVQPMNGPSAQFSVRDRGRGIPPDKLERVFERFQQVDASDSREKGGTGLGLAICQEIIEHHSGKIWVESVLGEGSTFFFWLPS